MDQDWISTGKANRLLNIGITDLTFRLKFRECLRFRMTPGGQFRWFKPDVAALAASGEEKQEEPDKPKGPKVA